MIEIYGFIGRTHSHFCLTCQSVSKGISSLFCEIFETFQFSSVLIIYCSVNYFNYTFSMWKVNMCLLISSVSLSHEQRHTLIHKVLVISVLTSVLYAVTLTKYFIYKRSKISITCQMLHERERVDIGRVLYEMFQRK